MKISENFLNQQYSCTNKHLHSPNFGAKIASTPEMKELIKFFQTKKSYRNQETFLQVMDFIKDLKSYKIQGENADITQTINAQKFSIFKNNKNKTYNIAFNDKYIVSETPIREGLEQVFNNLLNFIEKIKGHATRKLFEKPITEEGYQIDKLHKQLTYKQKNFPTSAAQGEKDFYDAFLKNSEKQLENIESEYKQRLAPSFDKILKNDTSPIIECNFNIK